jgi:hypothetical protein
MTSAGQTVKLKEVVKGHPIAFYAELGRIAGGALPGVLLSQLCYWSGRTKDPSGWFWKTQEQLTEEICLTRRELESARRKLRSKGLIDHKRFGVPCRSHYRVNWDEIRTALGQDKGLQASLSEKAHPVCPEAPQQFGESEENCLHKTAKPIKETETTKETTKRSTAESGRGGRTGEAEPSQLTAPPSPRDSSVSLEGFEKVFEVLAEIDEFIPNNCAIAHLVEVFRNNGITPEIGFRAAIALVAKWPTLERRIGVY